jgi:hypothetical protein
VNIRFFSDKTRDKCFVKIVLALSIHMDSKAEEEKMESAGEQEGKKEKAEKVEEVEEDCDSQVGCDAGEDEEDDELDEDEEDDELDEDEELVALPDELADIRDKPFATERDLLDELDERGFGDLRVVLLDTDTSSTPRMIIASHQHNGFTSKYVGDWFLRTRGELGWCSGSHKIDLANGMSRYPDISYWGSLLGDFARS